MSNQHRFITLACCLLLAGCSSDPDTFITYSANKNATGGTVDRTHDPKPTDALAFNYANSVEEIFRARSTGARYTREASDTALIGLAAFTGAGRSLSIGAAALSSMGIASAGILQLRSVFDASGRSNAYFEAAERVHGAIKDFRAHNLNDVSETSLSPNGWTLANIVAANIDIVDKILNGHLPTPDDLTQASEPMTDKGAVPQKGGTPVNNIPSTPLISPAMAAASNAHLRQPKGVSSADFQTKIKQDAPPPPPAPGERSPTQFGQDITAVDRKMAPEKKAAIYTALFKSAGIDLNDPAFKNLGPNLSPDAATLSFAYRSFPLKQDELNRELNQLQKDPDTAPVP